jgi:hypothetical protein
VSASQQAVYAGVVPDTILGVDLGVADASTDEIYAAMDWLVGRQDGIEKQLAARHLDLSVNPSRSPVRKSSRLSASLR